MLEIGGLIGDLIKNAAKAQAERKNDASAPSRTEFYKRFLVGGPEALIAPPAAPDPRQITVKLAAPARPPVPPAPAPIPAAQPHPPAALLADFRDPRRFIAAFVLAEALGPPVGLRRFEGERPG